MGQKWIMTSLTIWGLIITTATNVLPALGPWIGLDIDAGLIATIGETGTQFIKAAGGLVGAVMTFLGRWRAKTEITLGRPV